MTFGADGSGMRGQSDHAASGEGVHAPDVLDNILAFVGTLTPDGILTDANEPALRAAGLTRGDVIGRAFWDCYWWNHDAATQETLQRAIATARDGTPVRYDAEVRVADDRRIVIDFQVVPHRDADGAVDYLIPSGVDITERKRGEASLRDSEARFRATFDNAAVGIAHVAPDGGWLRVNRKLCDILGYSPEELQCLTFQDVTVAEDLNADLAQLQRMMAGEIDEYQMEKRYTHKDGATVWANLTVGCVRDGEGSVAYFISVIEDITSQKEAEQKQELLVAELNHRVKNILATIQAMASHTMRAAPDMGAFRETFTGRLQAIALAHDSIFVQGAGRPLLADVIRGQLRPYGADGADRLALSGPPVRLDPEITHALGLILHEMATNAAKYGALSAAGGAVTAEWERLRDGPGRVPRIRLTWTEAGGPPVTPPGRSGFGSRLIETTLQHSLGGSAELSYRPEGLHAVLEFPEVAGHDS